MVATGMPARDIIQVTPLLNEEVDHQELPTEKDLVRFD
jgi:hypothetical protein